MCYGAKGIPLLNARRNKLLKLAKGVYENTGLQISVGNEIVGRTGVESLEEDKINFVRTYLGVDCSENEIEAWGINNIIGGTQPIKTTTVSSTLSRAVKEEAIKNKAITSVPSLFSNLPSGGAKANNSVNSLMSIVGSLQNQTVSAAATVQNASGGNTDQRLGLGGIVEEVNQSNARCIPTAADGLCLGKAIELSMKDKGLVVDGFQEFIKEARTDNTWYDLDKTAEALKNNGLGLAVLNVAQKCWLGYNTDGKEIKNIIPIRLNNNHYEGVGGGTGPHVEKVDRFEEMNTDMFKEIMSGLA